MTGHTAVELLPKDGIPSIDDPTCSDSLEGDGDERVIVVESVTLHNGGFVTMHDSTLPDGAVLDSVGGTSEGNSDGPSVVAGNPVMESFDGAVKEEIDGGETESSADTGGPGFGVLVAVVAILCAGFVAVRRLG